MELDIPIEMVAKYLKLQEVKEVGEEDGSEESLNLEFDLKVK